jgi:hypothetical protein
MKFFSLALASLLVMAESRGTTHELFSSSPVGRLVDPPSRGTLWRWKNFFL